LGAFYAFKLKLRLIETFGRMKTSNNFNSLSKMSLRERGTEKDRKGQRETERDREGQRETERDREEY
jgi:hypothetical protein